MRASDLTFTKLYFFVQQFVLSPKLVLQFCYIVMGAWKLKLVSCFSAVTKVLAALVIEYCHAGFTGKGLNILFCFQRPSTWWGRYSNWWMAVSLLQALCCKLFLLSHVLIFMLILFVVYWCHMYVVLILKLYITG